MSKDIAEIKARKYAGITPDVNNVDKLPNQFVFVKTKYFSFVAGYTQAVTYLSTENAQLREALREAVANYMQSEGCSCCRDTEAHEEHTKVLAELLDVEMYEDNSGYNFHKYRTKAKQLLTDNTKEDEKE